MTNEQTKEAKHPYHQVLQWVAEGKELENFNDGFWSKCSYDAVLSCALHGAYFGAILSPQDFRLKPQRHVHQDLIDAKNTGARIQHYAYEYNEWLDCINNDPMWNENTKYRIKPEPKPDVVRYIHVTKDRTVGIASYFPSAWAGSILEVTLDGETGEIKHSKKYEGTFND